MSNCNQWFQHIRGIMSGNEAGAQVEPQSAEESCETKSPMLPLPSLVSNHHTLNP